MKITKRILITSALLLLSFYSIYTTVRIQRLESRLDREYIGQPSIRFALQPEQPGTRDALRIAYEFDDSFLKYFGQKGATAVESAMEMLRGQNIYRVVKHEEVDWDFNFLPDPLRLDDM